MIKRIGRNIERLKKMSDEHFFKTLMVLAIPIALQNIASASLNFIDNIMVGQLGDTAVASVGLANQVYFVVILFIFSIAGGASMFISQFWGKKDTSNISRIHGLSLLIVISACILIVIPAQIIPQKIIHILTNDPEVIILGGSFLRITSLSYILFGISVVYAVVLRNTGYQKIPLFCDLTAVIINTVLNYFLIFGHFGAPKLGVEGAAISTLISRVIGLSILLIAVYSHKWPASASFRKLFDLNMILVRRFFAQSSLLILKDMTYVLGVFTYMAIYARMGTSQVAAINILGPIMNIATVIFSSIAASCQMIVGNQLGANDHEKAFQYAGRFMKIAFFGGILVGIVLFSLRTLILLPYQVSDFTRMAAGNIIIIYSIYFPFFMFNMLTVVGVMRSGGDTIVCLVMDLIAIYLIGMPLALLGAFVWMLPIYLVYPMIWSQEFFKAVVMFIRYRSKKWMNNLAESKTVEFS